MKLLVVVVAMANLVAGTNTIADVAADSPTIQDLSKFLGIPLDGVQGLHSDQQDQLNGALLAVIMAVCSVICAHLRPNITEIVDRPTCAQEPSSAEQYPRAVHRARAKSIRCTYARSATGQFAEILVINQLGKHFLPNLF